MMFVKEFIVRLQDGKNRTVFFWENVEGALTDKTNAFGCFLAGLIRRTNKCKKVDYRRSGLW